MALKPILDDVPLLELVAVQIPVKPAAAAESTPRGLSAVAVDDNDDDERWRCQQHLVGDGDDEGATVATEGSLEN